MRTRERTPAVLIAVLHNRPCQLVISALSARENINVRKKLQEDDQASIVNLAKQAPIPRMVRISFGPLNMKTIAGHLQPEFGQIWFQNVLVHHNRGFLHFRHGCLSAHGTSFHAKDSTGFKEREQGRER
ncbi:uncharacterized protein LDX57_005856 [Aspergillus melleus]|uniref:uncharacterized protein n=1 Tax=Aspergillus melleus TaxID=138277 RepID=UPI001E8E7F72|nr:uncharacterized protein LDX57_005856 [Aspergillus melleus]KAH8428151.1 hypothetical protein LDX57_005856 [Aspergillus melleus]